MKKFIAIMLAVILALSMVSALAAEYSTEDYSWLDDLTINQLNELDKEIHKRIPNDGADSSDTSEESILIGEWDFEEVKEYYSEHKGHRFIVSMTFYPNGKFQWVETCQEDGKKMNNFGGKYELVSEDSVLFSFGLFSSTGTIYEDDGGLHLRYEASETYVFTKVNDK